MCGLSETVGLRPRKFHSRDLAPLDPDQEWTLQRELGFVPCWAIHSIAYRTGR